MKLALKSRIALFFAILLSTGSAFSWGADGHRVIALIATSKLTKEAQNAVAFLLSTETDATLESISIWADEHKSPSTASWHYLNFPRGSCIFSEQRDCQGGTCVVAAINRQIEILSSHDPDEKKLKALKYLVHLVGDVHQPLHAGYFDDKGGNKYQVQSFMRGSNLHAVWDTGLIKNLNSTPASIAVQLQKKYINLKAPSVNPATAAEESCRIVSATGFYPPRKVSEEYIIRFTPIMEYRLALAGLRLAYILNSIFK